MSDIEFVDSPPPAAAGRGLSREVEELIDKLKTEPGRWAIVDRGDRRGSRFRTLQRRGCEVAGRMVDGEHLLYARWPEDAS